MKAPDEKGRSGGMRRRAAVLCTSVALAFVAAGCADIDYRPATSHDEVVDITEKQILGDQRVRMKQEGRLLKLAVHRRCDLVEDKEMVRVSVKESEENVWLEALLMGLATAPLTTGAVVLADAPDVYDNDVHGRLYNKNGDGGAIAAGVLSLVLGTGMMAGGMVSIILRKMPDIDEGSPYHETGALLERDQPCDGPLRNAKVQVHGLLDNGQQVVLGNTNQRGELTVDLVRQVPASHFVSANPPLSLQVKVGDDLFGLVDLEPVAEHHQLRREKAWANAGGASCDEERTAAACAGVQAFLAQFRNGPHSIEARSLVANIGKPPPKEAKLIAGSTCEQKCIAKCENNRVCATQCIQKVCR
jgi:hypothetical protein